MGAPDHYEDANQDLIRDLESCRRVGTRLMTV